MKFHKKQWNSLLVVIFCCYWLFLFVLFIFQNQAWTESIRGNRYTFWMFPTQYKMYTSPPKQNLLIHYQFYKDEQKLGEVEIESFFQQLFETQSKQPEIFKHHALYSLYPRGAFKSIVNSHYYYQIDLYNQKIDSSWSFKDYLKNEDRRTFDIIHNQKLFAPHFIRHFPEFQEANHVKLIFERKQFHISKEFIDENGYDVAHKKSVIFTLEQSLN